MIVIAKPFWYNIIIQMFVKNYTGILKLVISLKVDIKKSYKQEYLYYLTTISYLHKVQCWDVKKV